MNEVRVRFAPSPTGFLHVGGARTAIFNWLYARSQNGKFLLRIEDTDLERSKSELSEQIIRSLKWLNMETDEPIVYQGARQDRHKEVVFELLKLKKAYYDFETTEEIEAKKQEAAKNNIQYKYDRAALNLSDEEVNEKLKQGIPFTVRFRVPDGSTVFDDIVHGKTEFNNSDIDDFIILRSDGSPVYQIAVVVDDHDMNITHVIRGDDHLSNTPKQIMIYNALDWTIPEFGHLPMILDEYKKKLSKRLNTVACEEYREMGYLAEAMFNFLTLLGYAPKDNREIISRDELIKEFAIERVNKKSAVFDLKKLNWINNNYIRNTDINVIAELIKDKLKYEEEFGHDYIIKVIELMRERMNTINEFLELGKYYFSDPQGYEEKGIMKYITEDSKDILKAFAVQLEGGTEDDAASYETLLRGFAELKGLKAALIIHPLRLALTGFTVSPDIFKVMELLGRETILRRIYQMLHINIRANLQQQ